MKAAALSPVVKRLLLIGGGHSHLAVLKRLGMHPVPGLETLLITREVLVPYSGALPAFISGHCEADDLYLDLHPLTQFAGVRLIQANVSQLDLNGKRVLLPGRPAIPFDLLSLNIGSIPDAARIPGASEHALAVKPLDQFIASWESLRHSAVQRIRNNAEFQLTIIGGGPASVELAFAMQARIQHDAGSKNGSATNLKIRLVTADAALLMAHNSRVRKFASEQLRARGIEALTDCRVEEIHAQRLVCAGHADIASDIIIYATGASPPRWPADCGLQTDTEGFIAVNSQLQSLSHPFVFASGDAASIEEVVRPKSGVYAVRQGKPLANNLLRYAAGKSLRPYRPQQHALALLYTGNKRAIASRAGWFAEGRWVGWWKHRIDNAFLKKYRELPTPSAVLQLAPGLLDRKAEQTLRDHALRCMGCGAKVGSALLADVLQEIDVALPDDVIAPAGGIEDAAQIALPDQRRLLQSVDFLPAFTNDPWLFARIASNHCLGDIYAMGTAPHSALAIAAVPFAGSRFMRETLRELMTGCLSVLNNEQVALIGGHTLEAAQLGFGLTVNSFAAPDHILSKTGVKAGDVLLLCKALGTGTLLAADMRFRARGPWMTAAIDSMLLSNRAAAQCLQQHQASACTDITGFGLAGHLLEMLGPGLAQAELTLDALPVLPGALACLEDGLRSSLHGDNQQTEPFIFNAEGCRNSALFDLLFDPQTAGGLLASVPAGEADACLKALRQAGYSQARIIGNIVATGSEQASIVLR